MTDSQQIQECFQSCVKVKTCMQTDRSVKYEEAATGMSRMWLLQQSQLPTKQIQSLNSLYGAVTSWGLTVRGTESFCEMFIFLPLFTFVKTRESIVRYCEPLLFVYAPALIRLSKKTKNRGPHVLNTTSSLENLVKGVLFNCSYS